MNATTETSINESVGEHRRIIALACLFALIFLNLAQVAAGLTSIEPRPPAFALPLIIATVAVGIFATVLTIARSTLGYYVGIPFALLSFIGMGPHKLLAEDGMIIAPVALLGFVLEVIYLWVAIRCVRAR